MEITIGRDKLVLSQRCVKDVLDLADYHEKKGQTSLAYNLVVMASVVEGSLKQTRKQLAWYKFLEKWKYRKYKVDYLLKKLNQAELLKLYTDVFSLEGVDLKKKVKVKQSQGKKQ